jgi:hypothetical protein
MNLFEEPTREPDSPLKAGQGDVFQMLWDCRFCGTPKLLGLDHRHCPNCGSPQSPEWRYFPSAADMKFVTDPDYQYTGADKTCPFCQQPNSAASKFCKQCGGDLSAAKEAERIAGVATGMEGASGERRDVVKEKFDRDLGIKPQAQQTPGFMRWLPFVVIGLVIACIAGFVFLSTSTYDSTLSVVDQRWLTGISLQERRSISDQNWSSSVPGDAYNVSCQPRQREYIDTVQEQCGFEYVDRGDGSGQRVPKMCSKQVTRYQTENYCRYTVDRWVPLPDLQQSGGPDDPIRKPSTAGAVGLSTGRIRVVDEYLRLIVIFQDPSNQQTYELNPTDEDTWRGYKVGNRYTVAINRLNIVSWETLKRLQE